MGHPDISVSFCKCRLRWVDALPKGVEKKKALQPAKPPFAVCVLFWTRKSWSQRQKKCMEHGHLIWLLDGLEWFATTRYLTSLGD